MYQLPDVLNLIGILQLFQADQLHVAARMKITRFIQDIGNPTTHAGGKIASSLAENHDFSAGHVFATVIADGLDNGVDTGVADGKTFAGHAANIDFTSGGTVECHITDDDIVLRGKGRTLWWINDEFAAAQALAEIVVGI